jgi:hypothetical protein
MTRPTELDHFEAEDPQPLCPDPQYQEGTVWGCLLGVAMVMLVTGGAVLLVVALRSLD